MSGSEIYSIEGYGLTVKLNQKAMRLMNSGLFQPALQQLKNCLNFLRSFRPNQNNLKLQATTLNNLGCIYKSNKQPKIAIHYLLQACRLLTQQVFDQSKLVGTYLNIASCYSDLGFHQKALQTTIKAFKIFQKSPQKIQNSLKSYIIVIHNIGVEYQHLNQLDSAFYYYKKALKTADENLSRRDKVYLMVLKSVREASRKVNKGVKRGRKLRYIKRVTRSRDSSTNISLQTQATLKASCPGLKMQFLRKQRRARPRSAFFSF